MAFSPIAFIIPQYEKAKFKNWWLKAYEQGTTTPKVIATDATGVTTASRIELNSEGFPETAGGAIFIPFIDGSYDLWAFPTAAEADANDTTSAYQFADNIDAEKLAPGDAIQTVDTAADISAGSFDDDDTVKTRGYTAVGDAGAGTYLIVSGDSSNGKNRILTANGKTAVLQIGASVHSAQFGSTPAIIYVATTGNDSEVGQGFDSNAPLLTPQAAADVLSGFGAYLAGQWEVSFAAGTYVGGFELDTATQTDFPVDIYGPAAGHPNVPTAIFDMTTDAGSAGVRSANYSWVRATDIKVINATSGSGAEVSNALLSLTNFHTDNCLKGCTNLHMGFVSVRGGDWDGNGLANSTGYQSFYSSTHDLIQASNDAATDALVIHDFDRGMLLNEGVQGHIDNVNILNCTTAGLNIKRGAGAANTKTMKIDGCGYGVLAENNAWFNNGIVFGSISANTYDVQVLGSSPELSFTTTTNTARTVRLLETTNKANHTGTGALTTVYESIDIPDWVYGEAGNHGRVTIYGSCSMALSTANVQFTLFDGTSESGIGTVTIPNGATEFKIIMDLSHTGAANHRGFVELHTDAGSDFAYTGLTRAVIGATTNIRAKVDLANSGDGVLFGKVLFEGTYGG